LEKNKIDDHVYVNNFELNKRGEKVGSQHTIGAIIIICAIIFIFLPFLSPHPQSGTPVPTSVFIETDENISIWQDITCTEPLEIRLKDLNDDPVIFYVRNDREYEIIATWQDNIFGDSNGLMEYFDEKNETWWLWPEYNPEGLSYVISIKSGQVLKVSYEVGAFRPFRFSFWGMKDPEKEPFQSRHAGVTDTPLV